MANRILGASFLIVALLVLRALFWRTISRRLQYALWGLVLLRLLVPWSLPASPLTALTGPLVEEWSEEMTVDPVPQVPADPLPAAAPAAGAPAPAASGWRGNPLRLMSAVCSMGTVAVAGFFFLANLHLWIRLRKNRCPASVPSCDGIPVWVVTDRGLPAPCAFPGGIYLTGEVDRDPDRRRHVLAHERTHLRHLDPLWALLRCVCLALFWYNPLVWIAAGCSRTDCELACDEAVVARMRDEERIAYGETLISLIPVRRKNHMLLLHSGLGEGKQTLRARISRIVRRPRQNPAVLLVLLLLVTAVSACSFSTGTDSSSASSPGSASGSGSSQTVQEGAQDPVLSTLQMKTFPAWERSVSGPFSAEDAWMAMREIAGIDPSRPSPLYPHMVYGADRGMPSDTVNTVLYFVEHVILQQQEDGTWTTNPAYDVSCGGTERYDDWRVRWMDYFGSSQWDLPESMWRFTLEVHPVDPEQMLETACRTRTEDGWFSPPYVRTSPIHFMYRSATDDWYKLALHRDLVECTVKAACLKDYSNAEALNRGPRTVIVAMAPATYDGTGLILPSESR